MNIIGIKHNDIDKKTYWFEVPESLVGVLQKGSAVICNTTCGKERGIAQTGVLSGDGIEIIAQKMGAKLPLRTIVSLDERIQVKDIKIHRAMKHTKPSMDKLVKRLTEFYETGVCNTEVSISKNGFLKDGYTAYLIAKMFDLEFIPVAENK